MSILFDTESLIAYGLGGRQRRAGTGKRIKNRTLP